MFVSFKSLVLSVNTRLTEIDGLQMEIWDEEGQLLDLSPENTSKQTKFYISHHQSEFLISIKFMIRNKWMEKV